MEAAAEVSTKTLRFVGAPSIETESDSDDEVVVKISGVLKRKSVSFDLEEDPYRIFRTRKQVMALVKQDGKSWRVTEDKAARTIMFSTVLPYTGRLATLCSEAQFEAYRTAHEADAFRIDEQTPDEVMDAINAHVKSPVFLPTNEDVLYRIYQHYRPLCNYYDTRDDAIDEAVPNALLASFGLKAEERLADIPDGVSRYGDLRWEGARTSEGRLRIGNARARSVRQPLDGDTRVKLVFYLPRRGEEDLDVFARAGEANAVW